MKETPRLANLFSGHVKEACNGFSVLKPLFDSNGRIEDFEWVSGIVYNLSSHQPSDIGLSGQRLLSMYPELENNGILSRLIRVFEQGDPEGFEAFLPSKNELLGINAFKAQDLLGLYCTNNTREKELETNYLVNEEKMKSLFELIPLGVCITDKEGVIIECNPAATSILSFLGKENFKRSLFSQDVPLYKQDGSRLPIHNFPGVIALLENRKIENVELMVKQGKEDGVWLSVSATPLFHSNLGVLISFMDITGRVKMEEILRDYNDSLASLVAERTKELNREITERKLVEKQLRKALRGEKKLMAETNAILDAVPALVMIGRDRGCSLITGNKAAHERLQVPTGMNLSRSAPEGERVATFRVFKDGVELDSHELPMQVTARTGEPLTNYEQKVVFENGEEMELYGNTAPLFDDCGNVSGSVAAFVDLTELKKTREALEESTVRLRQMVAAKDKLFSIIGHDLKNPFNAVIGFSDLLLRRVKEKGYEDLYKLTELLFDSSQSLYGLLENLLDWSRIQQGQKIMNPEEVDLYQVVDEIKNLFNLPMQRKGIVLMNRVSPGTRVWVDMNMLSTVVRNILGNAIKFTPREGIITMKSSVIGNMVQVSISDTGVGMEQSQIQKVLDANSILSTEGTDLETGTGLGLILCKDFIESNGGQIWARSEIGKGSEFFFTIPLCQ